MPNQPKKPEVKNNKEYEKLIRNLTNTASASAIYPPGHPLVEKQFAALWQQINQILETENLISIHRGEGILIVNDQEIILTEQLTKKVARHFDVFKITDLEISKGLTTEELKSFLEIFAHSDKSAAIYPSLGIACQKNQIAHIRSLQAAGLDVTTVKDVSPQAHNGCRPKKRRRV